MACEPLYRLSDATVVEPLVDKWSAWSHLMSPIPSSLHLINYQIKLLQSYLKDPRSHVETCKDAKLRSGPFVDIPEQRADEVERLLAETLDRFSENIKLAKTVTEFHNKLVREARGQSLTPLYKIIPDVLRGYAELVYDYYNRPTARFFESLLYESPYYRPDAQSLNIFRQRSDGSRPFFMSTPRLHQDDQIGWSVPFESKQIDELFQTSLKPQPLEYIREILELDAGNEDRLLDMLSSQEVPAREEWNSSAIRLRYFGHACLLIECNGVSVLTDPYIAVKPYEEGIDRYTYSDLPEKIDYVIVTHNHHDHFCIEPLLRLRHRIGSLVVPRSSGLLYGDISLKLLAKKIGFKNVIEVDALETIPLPGGEIVAVPFMGEHADLAHSKTAYIVRLGKKSFLFAADSDCLDKRLYEHIRRIIGPIETLFIGMECVGAPLSWSCGPFLPYKPDFNQEQTRRYKGCDSSRALEIIEALGVRELYIYAMGLEPWLEYLLGLALDEDSEQLKQAGVLLNRARERGMTTAKLLCGIDEMHYNGAP